MKKSLAWMIRAEMLDQNIREAGEGSSRHIIIHLHLPRRFDQDNAMGGQKILIDAMKEARLIKNDSLRWLNLELIQHIDKERFIDIEIKGE